MAKTVLLGAFGQGNYGDEWILESALGKWPGARARTRGPLPPGVRPAPTTWLSSPDTLVMPGGALFQDSTSALSCIWYLQECWGALARGGLLLATDMDFSELASGRLRSAARTLFGHPRARLLLRPGAAPFASGVQGPDGVGAPAVSAPAGRVGWGWAPSPLGGCLPPGVDRAFLADARAAPAADALPHRHRHRPGKLTESHGWLAGLEGLVSGRYHPLLLRWSLGLPGAGNGPAGGKVEALCRRAGYPFYAFGERPKGPRPPARAWRGARA